MTHTIIRIGLLVVLLVSGATTAMAQELRGTVTIGESTTAAVGVIIEATDVATGERAARTITNQTGYFTLRLTGGREVSVRALRIGNRPTELGNFTLAVGEVKSSRFALTGAAVNLDRVEVMGDRVCELSRAEAAQVLTLFDEARKAIAATQIQATGTRLQAEWTIESQMTSLRGVPIGEKTVRTIRAATEQPFVSLTPDSLEKVGYLSTENDSWVYQAPDARLLLSEQFVRSNCFRAVPWDRDSLDWVGIGFSPSRPPARGHVGIEGTLWLDRKSAELRRMEYSYLNLPREISGTSAGGEVEFLRLPFGAWLVNRWEIRMPRPTVYTDAEFRSGGRQTGTRQTTRITSMEVAGGNVREVRRGANVVYRAAERIAVSRADADAMRSLCESNGVARPMIYGTLRDSANLPVGNVEIIAKWEEGHRYFSAITRSSESQQLTTKSETNGLWYFCGVPAGQRVELRTMDGRAQGDAVITRMVDANTPTETMLFTTPRSAPGGTVEGVVVDSLAGGVRWADVDVVLVGTNKRARTDNGGNFRIRGVEPGQYEAVVLDPRALFFGLGMPSATVTVPDAGTTTTVGLSSLGPAATFASVCGRAPADGEGVLVGEVRDLRTARREGVIVTGTWSRMTFARGISERMPHSASDTTGPDGRYVLCGVPTIGTLADGGGGVATLLSGEITVRAQGNGLSSGDVVAKLEGAALARRDLVVSESVRTTVLVGRVLDAMGAPIPNAVVTIAGNSAFRTNTDSRGAFRLQDVPLHSLQLVVRAIRYLPQNVDLDPSTGRLVAGDIKLERIPQQLEAVTVAGAAGASSRVAFEERRRGGVGTFLDDEWISKMPVLTIQNVRAMIPKTRMALDTLGGFTTMYKIAFEVDGNRPGVQGVDPNASETTQLAQAATQLDRTMRLCFPRWYVDGVDFGIPTAPEEGQLLAVAKRIEAYRAMEMPPRFIDFSGCGVIAIATRD